MNERINELARQASNQSFGHLRNTDFERKFSELIIKECAKIVSDTEYPYEDESFKETWDACCVWTAEDLKKQFGFR